MEFPEGGGKLSGPLGTITKEKESAFLKKRGTKRFPGELSKVKGTSAKNN